MDYYKMIVGCALAALTTGNERRVGAILQAGGRGEAIPEDPQGRTLEYCEYRQGWPLTETGARN
jgi:hypothetical protein